MDQIYHLNDSKSSDNSFQKNNNENDEAHGVSPPQEEVDKTLQFF